MTNILKRHLLRATLCTAMASTFSLPIVAAAQNTNQVTSINDCQIMDDAALRLQCFDTLFATKTFTPEADIEAVTTSPKVTIPVASTPKPVIEGFGDRSGKDDLTRAVKKPAKSRAVATLAPSRVTSITDTVSKIDVFGYKKLRITLANGQVWEQIGSVTQKAPKLSSKRPMKAEIREAALGSFSLQFNGKGRAFKVKRVR